MIAEDDLLIADMVRDVLVHSGYQVCGIARTVAEGIELGERHKPDLAVLDIRLAGNGLGPEIVAKLGCRDTFGVLYATGNDHVPLTTEDGDACIMKPYRPSDLVRALQIVEEIISTGAASPPFPRGFRVLQRPAMKSGYQDPRRGDRQHDRSVSQAPAGKQPALR